MCATIALRSQHSAARSLRGLHCLGCQRWSSLGHYAILANLRSACCIQSERVGRLSIGCAHASWHVIIKTQSRAESTQSSANARIIIQRTQTRTVR